jgi:lactoylglutathione lyase
MQLNGNLRIDTLNNLNVVGKPLFRFVWEDRESDFQHRRRPFAIQQLRRFGSRAPLGTRRGHAGRGTLGAWHVRLNPVPPSPMIVPELYCSNFERTLAFYVGVVGFTAVYQREEERFAYLSLAGADLMIEQTTETERTLLADEPVHPYGRGVNLQISVDEIQDLFARITTAGSPIFRTLEERWYQRNDDEVGVRQFVAMDPDGYLLRFSQSIGQRRAS